MDVGRFLAVGRYSDSHASEVSIHPPQHTEGSKTPGSPVKTYPTSVRTAIASVTTFNIVRQFPIAESE
jgi:hypothetical protein